MREKDKVARRQDHAQLTQKIKEDGDDIADREALLTEAQNAAEDERLYIRLSTKIKRATARTANIRDDNIASPVGVELVSSAASYSSLSLAIRH